MTGYSIRPVQHADHVAVVALLQDISVFMPGVDALAQAFDRFQQQPHVVGLVAVTPDADGERVVGYGSLCLEVKIRGGSMGHIEEIVVAADFRGNGVGRAIVNALIERGKASGAYKVALECRPDKEGFYCSLGFQATGTAMSRLTREPNGRPLAI